MRHSLRILFLCLILGLGGSLLHGQTGKSAALECLGGLTGVALYNTYGFIGAVGDGYEEKMYEGTYAKELMDEQIVIIGSLREQMSELLNSGFLSDESDKAYVSDVLETLDYLEMEAEGLKLYVDEGSTDDFQENREKAWANISVLLGLEED
jgi:hypothetical protein